MKSYMDDVTDNYETIIMTRKDNKNIVMMSEEGYNNLTENLHIMEDKTNYDWQDYVYWQARAITWKFQRILESKNKR